MSHQSGVVSPKYIKIGRKTIKYCWSTHTIIIHLAWIAWIDYPSNGQCIHNALPRIFDMNFYLSLYFLPSMQHPCRIFYMFYKIFIMFSHIYPFVCIHLRLPVEHSSSGVIIIETWMPCLVHLVFYFRVVCSAIPIHNNYIQCAHRSNWIFSVCNFEWHILD